MAVKMVVTWDVTTCRLVGNNLPTTVDILNHVLLMAIFLLCC
jgi:hypothetical protein